MAIRNLKIVCRAQKELILDNSLSLIHHILPHSNQQKRERAKRGIPLPFKDVSWRLHVVILLIFLLSSSHLSLRGCELSLPWLLSDQEKEFR